MNKLIIKLQWMPIIGIFAALYTCFKLDTEKSIISKHPILSGAYHYIATVIVVISYYSLQAIK